MVKSKKPSMPPVTVWPEAAPSREEDKLLSLSIRNDHIYWSAHEGVADNWAPLLFWRTPPIEIDDRGTNLQNFSTYLCDRAKEIIFGSKTAEPTLQNAIRASTERRVSVLSVYIVSTNDDQLKTLHGLLSEIPCRVYVLKEDDFYTQEQGRSDGMEIHILASLRAAGEHGYPALVFDGGANADASTYSHASADENGNIMGGGIVPGFNLQRTSLSTSTTALPQTTLTSVEKELASLMDEDGKVARTPEEQTARGLCMEISRTGQSVIEKFLHNVGRSEPNGGAIKRNTDRVIHVTGEYHTPSIARLLEPNCPLIESPPLPLPKYEVEMKKYLVHYGIASVLKENVEEFEKGTTAELDVVLIGQRIAKQFSIGDQDGDRIYRGSVACVHGSGSEFPYGIHYDDGDTEDMNALQLYEALNLYVRAGEKESFDGESSREIQPRQPPEGAKINGAKAAASQLATKDKTVEEVVTEKKRAQSKALPTGTLLAGGSKDKPGLVEPGPPRVAQAPLDLREELEPVLRLKRKVWTRKKFRESVEDVHKRHGIPAAQLDSCSGSHIKCTKENCDFHLGFSYNREKKLSDKTVMWSTSYCNYEHKCLGDVNNGSVAEDTKLPARKKHNRGNGNKSESK